MKATTGRIEASAMLKSTPVSPFKRYVIRLQLKMAPPQQVAKLQ